SSGWMRKSASPAIRSRLLRIRGTGLVLGAESFRCSGPPTVRAINQNASFRLEGLRVDTILVETAHQATEYRGGTYDSAEPNDPWMPFQDYGHNHWRNSLFYPENQHKLAWLGPVSFSAWVCRTGRRDRGVYGVAAAHVTFACMIAPSEARGRIRAPRLRR